MRLIKLTLLLCFFVLIGCNTKKENNSPIDSETKKETSRDVITKNASKIFLLEDEISLPDEKDIFYSKGNEIILFRPTESDFGILLEETQDQNLLDLDGNFEALTNQIIINFSNSENAKISICEKPIIAIPQEVNTLYFDTSKELYGIIFSKEGEKPLFKSAKEKDLIQQIKEVYNL